MNTHPVGERRECPNCPANGRDGLQGRPRPTKIATQKAKQCHECYCDGRRVPKFGGRKEHRSSLVGVTTLGERLLHYLRQTRGVHLTDLADAAGVKPSAVKGELKALQLKGVNLHIVGDVCSLASEPEPGLAKGVQPYTSRPDNTYVFGAMGDTHLGSKYARLDVLKDLYERFAEAGVDRVFHAGNWIDGEDDRKNKYDLVARGLDGQLEYMANEYPVVPGLLTYAVAGQDHEGWYGQREGIDIGRHAESMMRDAGREDWVHLGHMEAFVPLVNANTGRRDMLQVMHPGGGSSYAVSYTMQKIVEAMEGGEKPALLLAGHFHKMGYLRTRNVRTLQTGCTQDLTPWARGKRLRYEIGGWIVTLKQNPDNGVIYSATFEDFVYFNRGFYTNERWSNSGDVVHVPRVPSRRTA